MDKALSVNRICERPFEAVIERLRENPGAVLGRATDSAVEVANEVVLYLESKWAWFDLEESVKAQVGEMSTGTAMAQLPLSWTADRHKRLLPSVDGHLSILALSAKHTELTFVGEYAPPFGILGGIEDFLLGRRVLEAAIGKLVDEIVDQLETAISEPVPD